MTYPELLSIPEDYLNPVIKGNDAFLVTQIQASIFAAKWLQRVTFFTALVSVFILLILFNNHMSNREFSLVPFLAQISGVAFSFVPFFLARLYLLHLHRTFLKREYDVQVVEAGFVEEEPIAKSKNDNFDFCHHCGQEIQGSPGECPHCGKNLS